jgi:hypothetical protein
VTILIIVATILVLTTLVKITTWNFLGIETIEAFGQKVGWRFGNISITRVDTQQGMGARILCATFQEIHILGPIICTKEELPRLEEWTMQFVLR